VTAPWRIDDLAREAGLTVDTIRYYAREGLLPPPERAGRRKHYGPPHLERLERIRELQDRRFSLAAIKAVLDADRPGIESVFADAGRAYTLDELVERSGVERELVERLRAVELLRDPEDSGRDAYDAADLGLLEAVAQLRRIGMPEGLLVEVAAIYVRHFSLLQEEVVEVFAGRAGPDWDPEELVDVQQRLTANAGQLIPAVDRVLDYVHRRTLERVTLDAIREAREEGRGVGGVALDP
jgi:DNA-binding transcriptional MerR regulator